MQTIGILGCGWLGEPLAEYLIGSGYTVKGSTTTPDKLERLKSKGIQPYLIRLDPDGPLLNESFFAADVLFLNIPPGRRDPHLGERFPKQIALICNALHGGQVRLVVFAGSTSVYPDLNRVVTEEDAGGEISASGDALLHAERELQTDGRFAVTVLRFAGLYGYSRRPGRFLAGKQQVEYGDAPVNLVHRDDCVQVAAEVIRRNMSGETLNVCSDVHPTRRALYTQRALELGLEPPAFVEGQLVRYKIVSNERLKQMLGYTFLYPDPLQPAP